jgi:hypothetical protein
MSTAVAIAKQAAGIPADEPVRYASRRTKGSLSLDHHPTGGGTRLGAWTRSVSLLPRGSSRRTVVQVFALFAVLSGVALLRRLRAASP